MLPVHHTHTAPGHLQKVRKVFSELWQRNTGTVEYN